ncbi:MAG: hypothetical protein HY049_03065 [Acidobacteria bacterium]|nr:hypothetical protein [Acidobacteriota bacterium]
MRRPPADSDLWVITAYFNLAGWSSRLENYRSFRRALEVPLATVEWSPAGAYALGGDDADLLMQIPGGDLMWQKERLLGLALSALPDHVRYVAWVDCDVIFADPLWHERTRRLLRDYRIVQPFRRVAYLRPEATRRIALGRESAAEACANSAHPSRPSFLDLFERIGDDIARVDLSRRFDPVPGGAGRYDIMARPAYGHAWAARTETLRRIGFYERCVVGGGDLMSAYALVGRAEEMIANHRSVGWDFYGGGASYRNWAAPAADACRGNLACGDETLAHLFHGTLEDRQYRSRIDGLAPFGLDIDRDIAAEPGAPWSWTRSAAELNGYFLAYIRNRREDG